MDTSKKIIRGIVNSRGFTITSAITQWDYGWQFIPEIEDLPATYRLDFSNEEKRGTALPVYCSTDGAEVPTELIDTGKDIWVWYVAIGDGYGITEYKWRIPNHCRPSGDGETPTPTQQSSIDQLIVRSNEAVTSAEQSASDADASAQSASADADRAEEARTDAQNFATQAETSADNASASASQASASATASANSASASAQIKSDIEGMVEDAEGYADSASQSATASANSATTAQGYAQSASASAQSASGYASNAQISANTASAKAQDASTSAQTASQKATESAQSASQALSYKMDAESAKTASQTAQGLAESARDSAITAKNDAEQAKADAESARDEAVSAVASISGALADKAPVITDTASGSIASFTDGADDLPLKSLVVNIDPVQDLSNGDPSPENICPISGWTEVNVNHSDADMTNPTTITINLGRTVYGGKLDVLSGELVIDRAGVDLGTLNWRKNSTQMLARDLSPVAESINTSTLPNATCSIYKATKWGSIASTDNSFCVISNQVIVYDSRFTDVTAFKTAVTGQTLMYALATPIEIQLSPNEINSLLGVNNIWSDSGDTTAEYRADTKAYIAKKIAEALASLT